MKWFWAVRACVCVWACLWEYGCVACCVHPACWLCLVLCRRASTHTLVEEIRLGEWGAHRWRAYMLVYTTPLPCVCDKLYDAIWYSSLVWRTFCADLRYSWYMYVFVSCVCFLLSVFIQSINQFILDMSPRQEVILTYVMPCHAMHIVKHNN